MTIEEGALRRAVSAGGAAYQVRFLGLAGGRTDHPRFLNMGSPMSPTRRLSDAILIASSLHLPKRVSFLDMGSQAERRRSAKSLIAPGALTVHPRCGTAVRIHGRSLPQDPELYASRYRYAHGHEAV